MVKTSDIQFLSDALLKTRQRVPKAKEHRPSIDIEVERPKSLHLNKTESGSPWRAIFFSLLLTFNMVTMNATSKLAMKFSSHPQQMGIYKTSLFAIMTFASAGFLKADLDLEQVGVSKTVLIKKGFIMGLLSLTQNFVSRTLPMSITATINSLSPLVNSFMAAYYLHEKINYKIDIPLMFLAGFGTLICSKPPFLMNRGGRSISYTSIQYIAISVSIMQVLIRSRVMCFMRKLRTKGAKTAHFKQLAFYDSLFATIAMFIASVGTGKADMVFGELPHPYMIGLLLVVAMLHLLRPYLSLVGNNSLPVSIASVLGCTNVLFSVFYSVVLFQDKSVDLVYLVGTIIVIATCSLKVYLSTSDGRDKAKPA